MKTLSQNVFVPNNVDLVLNGHTHFYQHNLVSGIHHLVTAGGGAGLETQVGSDSLCAKDRQGLQLRHDRHDLHNVRYHGLQRPWHSTRHADVVQGVAPDTDPDTNADTDADTNTNADANTHGHGDPGPNTDWRREHFQSRGGRLCHERSANNELWHGECRDRQRSRWNQQARIVHPF